MRFVNGVFTQVDAEIPIERRVFGGERFGEEAFAAAKVENALGLQRLQLSCKRRVQTIQRQPLERIRVCVFISVALGGVFADCCCAACNCLAHAGSPFLMRLAV